MSKLQLWWSDLRSSFWFLPSLIVAGHVLLAVGLIEVDTASTSDWMARWPRLLGSGAEGARGMLSTIAGSMMSVVGVAFSMTLVALTLAASQFSSRVLRTFIRSRVTQSTLGTFAGIFSYCLIVLRAVRSGAEGGFVPHVAVLFAFLLALAGVGVLIFFIHHIATSIQATTIVASVADETLGTIDRLFPELAEPPGRAAADGAEGAAALALPDTAGPPWHTVAAARTGYIQGVDMAALMEVARALRAVVRMEHGVGAFVIQGTGLVSIARADPPDPDTADALRKAYAIARHRTAEQDAAFGIRQIVDVALRALSPGINDTTTAVICVDYLTAILAHLAPRALPAATRCEAGELRVIAKGPSFDGLVHHAFDQIRSSAAGNVAVLTRLLEACHTVAGLTRQPDRRRSLREQVQWIEEQVRASVDAAHERAALEWHVARVRQGFDLAAAVLAGADAGVRDASHRHTPQS